MTVPIEELWSMPEPALIGAYHSARRNSWNRNSHATPSVRGWNG
jgi:hypothetical protein